jgi:predicted nucleic acid-binding protein
MSGSGPPPTGCLRLPIKDHTSLPTLARYGAKTCMNGAKAFFDTNVLLYMYGGDAVKRARAQELFRQYAQTGRMLLSTQVVQEFYAAGSGKLGIPRRELREAVAALLDFPLIVVGPSQIASAIENAERHQIPFWDALILAAAASGGAQLLYTEDLNDGQQYGTIMAQNPFR